jgi:hypothetical protein
VFERQQGRNERAIGRCAERVGRRTICRYIERRRRGQRYEIRRRYVYRGRHTIRWLLIVDWWRRRELGARWNREHRRCEFRAALRF